MSAADKACRGLGAAGASGELCATGTGDIRIFMWLVIMAATWSSSPHTALPPDVHPASQTALRPLARPFSRGQSVSLRTKLCVAFLEFSKLVVTVHGVTMQ